MRFALIMRATSSLLVPEVTPAWLARAAAGVEVQLDRDLSPVWGGNYAVRVSDGTDLQPGEVAFSIVDQLPDAPGAVAYHDVAGADVPVAFLALSTCSTLDDVSTAISHEACEAAGDAACDLWADDGLGHEFARELCDAVEANSYPIDLGDGGAPVVVSDFLLPGFFGPGDPGPFSHMQASPSPSTSTAGFPSVPFATAPGGYQITRSGAGAATQVNGTLRARRHVHARHWSSRTYRRGARLEAG